MAVTDLDAALITVRDPRSRQYMGDAVRAYRTGAYRPAITASWVAVAFDLIQKYRELASQGEGEARNYLVDWDNAVAAEDAAKLTKMEGELLKHAYDNLSMFNSAGYKALSRLREDRHTSAHPAFVSVDELYEPSNEQTRAHMAAAIEIVLSQQPIRGKGIMDSFGIDLVSPGFPIEPDALTNYVERKYIAQMRPSIVRNFGAVLAKSVIKDNVPGWGAHSTKVIRSLQAIQLRRPEDWTSIQADILAIIETDTPDYRSNALALLGTFPELANSLSDTVMTALGTHCTSAVGMMTNPRSFEALRVPALSGVILATYGALSEDNVGEVIQFAPLEEYWPRPLTIYAGARSFRGAEVNFDRFVAPFATKMNEAQLTSVFNAAASNGQIAHAGGTPEQLLSLVANGDRRPDSASIDAFYLVTRRSQFGSFPALWARLREQGWQSPAPPPPDDDLDV